RRHTRFSRDWSSDVCSSDLLVFVLVGALAALTASSAPAAASGDGILLLAHGGRAQWNDNVNALAASIDREIPVEVAFGMATRSEIGRASCRERVEMWVGAVA